MASPQVENGHVKIASELFDALCKIRIPGETRQVLDCILRKTYGWNKKCDAISLSQFMESTGLNKQHIIKAIHKLEEMNLIVTLKDTPPVPKKVTNITRYRINKDYETWQPLPKKVTLPKKVITPVPKKVHTKDTITKDNILTSSGDDAAAISENKKAKIPYQDIVDLFNEFLPELPEVRFLNETRKMALKGRWLTDEKTKCLDWWKEYFLYIKESNFLMGRKSKWQCCFDWILKPANFIKIREGSYENR